MYSDAKGISEIADIPIIPATGHNEVTDAQVEPTCEMDGKTAGAHCSVCQTIITAQTTIPKLNHNWSAWSIITEPALTTPGMAERICANDSNHKDKTTVPVLADETVWTADARVEPTETEDGSQAYASDYGSITIAIPALGHTHDWGMWSIVTEPTLTAQGVAERICTKNKEHKDTSILPVLTDETVWTAGTRIEPTETAGGLQAYISIYGIVVVILPATGSEYAYSIRYENEKAVVNVPQDDTYTLIFAAYDTDNRLLSVSAQDVYLVKGENPPIPPQNFNADGKIKILLWNSLTDMKPLAKTEVQN